MDDLLTTPTVTSPLNKIQKESNPSQAELDGKKLADDFDDFLLLLTTQLQNQDPTAPLDTNEFTSQLVQFASVEQAVATNTNLEKLVSASAATGIQQGLGFIGKSIEAEGSSGVLADGKATFIYELPQNAASVNVSILDSTGRAVFSGEGNKSSGKNTVIWDGINSLNGQEMTDGTYQIVVNAKNTKDEKIEAKTFTTGRVTSAEVDSEGTTYLSIGTTKVKADDVIAVREIPETVKVLPQAQAQAESVVESAFNTIF